MKVLACFMTLALAGCATVGELPRSAGEVNFTGPEGKTGWSKYQQVEFFRDQTPDNIYSAAKAGLSSAGFSLRKADLLQGMVVGEHEITLHDWNVVSAVYFKQQEGGVRVLVLTQESKDTGVSGDVTGDGWNGKIIRGMYQYINDTQTSILRVKKDDIK